MNYYEELGIEKEATMAEIKGAYRQLAKKYHPERATRRRRRTGAGTTFCDTTTA